jgi:predicted DNA-binding transcriptional regulator AlpA
MKEWMPVIEAHTEASHMMDCFLRLKQIVPDIIPISKTTWWRGIKEGKYPQPVHLGARTTAWRKSDIQKLVDKFQEGE